MLSKKKKIVILKAVYIRMDEKDHDFHYVAAIVFYKPPFKLYSLYPAMSDQS